MGRHIKLSHCDQINSKHSRRSSFDRFQAPCTLSSLSPFRQRSPLPTTVSVRSEYEENSSILVNQHHWKHPCSGHRYRSYSHICAQRETRRVAVHYCDVLNLQALVANKLRRQILRKTRSFFRFMCSTVTQMTRERSL